MTNVLIQFSVPAHLIKSYMQRMVFINSELKRAVKEMQKEGVVLTPPERELLQFDINTNILIHDQLLESLNTLENLQQTAVDYFPQSVKDEVASMIKGFMKNGQ